MALLGSEWIDYRLHLKTMLPVTMKDVKIIRGAGVFGATEVAGTKEDVLWLSQSIDHASEITIRATEPLKLLDLLFQLNF